MDCSKFTLRNLEPILILLKLSIIDSDILLMRYLCAVYHKSSYISPQLPLNDYALFFCLYNLLLFPSLPESPTVIPA